MTLDAITITHSLTVGLLGLYREIKMKTPQRQSRLWKRPLLQQTLRLHENYNAISKKRAEARKKIQAAAPATTLKNGEYDDENDDYIIRKGEVWKDRFKIQGLIGKGSFGQVVQAYDNVHDKMVAIKIIKNRKAFTNQGLIEIRILKFLNEKTKDEPIVKMIESFEHRNHLCIVYELLSFNLYEILRKGGFQGLPLPLVRKFATQILTCLELLSRKDVQVIHCDLKPENVLLVSPKSAMLKVIDFGSSCFLNERAYSYIQSRFYRSPEVILGIPYHTPIDMWSFGCMAMELLTGTPVFAGNCEHSQLEKIINVIGLPPPELIEKSSAEKLERFFVYARRGQYTFLPHEKGQKKKLIDFIKDKIPVESLSSDSSASDIFNFLDWIERILTWSPEDRMTPSEALCHPFIKPMIDASANTDYTIQST